MFHSTPHNRYGVRTMNDNQSAFYVNQALPCFLYKGNPYDTPQAEIVHSVPL
jgi:hypothetical protein